MRGIVRAGHSAAAARPTGAGQNGKEPIIDTPIDSSPPSVADDVPGDQVYDWYVRGLDLLGNGHPNAAAEVLTRAATAAPESRSIREALARAQFDAGNYGDARDSFARNVAADPVDHYAQFGLGLAAHRTGDLGTAVEHLALAVAMRPDLAHYRRALQGARAARDARP